LKIVKALAGSKINDGGLDVRARKLLLGRKMGIIELSDRLNVPPRTAKRIVERLAESGLNVKLAADVATIEKSVPQGCTVVVDARDFFDGEWHKFGLVSDTHLCSRWQRIDVLEALYDIFKREGVKRVYHAGNIVDGEFRFNQHDLLVPSGFNSQAEYMALNYPKRNGLETHFVCGDDHEGWWVQREGIDVGKALQQACEDHGRKDLKYLAYVEADIHLKARKGEAWMRIMHPGGGSTYATSYTEQKIVESFQGGEKPHILILGHYHKFNQGYAREVHTIQAGCVQDQTPFLRKLKIQCHVGGSIVRWHQAETGEINRFAVEWFPFYDRGFYEKTEKYRRW
jgi:hypothetical protein